jgi:hypothetical protein
MLYMAIIVSLLAIVGFKKSLWFVAAALAGHGLFDLVHPLFIKNPGVPQWWPGFCVTFDAVAGAWLARRIITRSLKPTELGSDTTSSWFCEEALMNCFELRIPASTVVMPARTLFTRTVAIVGIAMRWIPFVAMREKRTPQ